MFSFVLSVMSFNNMVLQYNCSDLDEKSITGNVDPIGGSAAPLYHTALGQHSYIDEYKNVQRERLKRKTSSSDCPTSSKFRPTQKSLKRPFCSPNNPMETSQQFSNRQVQRAPHTAISNNSSNRPVTGKQRKMELTLHWLEDNYVISEGVCLARCILYNHYKDFCDRNDIDPACPATFGKTIRKKFPRVTTRRLGTRGHSKYHYYGIGIRESSIYYNSVYAGKGLTRFSPKVKVEDEHYFSSSCFSQKEAVHTFLDEVPNATQVSAALGNDVSLEQVQEFLNRYKGSCQEILTAAQSQNFEVISTSLLQCWSDMSFQLHLHLLRNAVVMDIITLYDCLLYDALIEVILPLPVDSTSERQLLAASDLGKRCEEWTKTAAGRNSLVLVGKKLTIAQQFSQSIIRQISFIKLCRTVRSIFNNPAAFSSIRTDIEKIELENVGSQPFYYNSGEESKDGNINNEFLKDLKELLMKNANTDMLIEWLDAVIDAKVIKPSKQNGRSLKKRAQDFMLKWSFFGARITHNLSITNALSFNSFHYLRMFLDEYILLAIETQFNNEKRLEIKNTVTKHTKNLKTPQIISNTQSGGSPSATNHSSILSQTPTDYKCEIQRTDSSKGWELGYWSAVSPYDQYSKITESAFEVLGNSCNEFDTSGTFCPCSVQTYPNSAYPGSYYTNSYQAQPFLLNNAKSDTFFNESGSTFAYVGETQEETSQSYNPTYQAGSTESFSPAYDVGITKEESSLNPSPFTNCKPSIDTFVPFLQYEQSKPHPRPCTLGQILSNTTSPNQLAVAEKTGQSETEDGYLLQDISCAQSPSQTNTSLAEYISRVNLKPHYKNDLVSRQNTCFYPVTQSGEDTTLSTASMSSQSTPSCYFDESQTFSNEFSSSRLLPPQSVNKNTTWNASATVNTETTALRQYSTASTTVQDNLPSISSVLV